MAKGERREARVGSVRICRERYGGGWEGLLGWLLQGLLQERGVQVERVGGEEGIGIRGEGGSHQGGKAEGTESQMVQGGTTECLSNACRGR